MALAMAPDGATLYVGCFEGDLRIIRAGERQVNFLEVGGQVHDVALTADGRWLFAALSHSGLKRIDTDTGTVDTMPSTGCPMFLYLSGNSSLPAGNARVAPFLWTQTRASRPPLSVCRSNFAMLWLTS